MAGSVSSIRLYSLNLGWLRDDSTFGQAVWHPPVGVTREECGNVIHHHCASALEMSVTVAAP